MGILSRGCLVPLVWLLASLLAAAADDGPDIHLWPLVENRREADGGHHSSALLLWHRTTAPDGSLRSAHYFNYITSPGFEAVLPLWYVFRKPGEPGRSHSMLLPLWFQGPGYAVAPLALSGAWREADGGSSLWITPLFHRRTAADGTVSSLHALTYAQGDGYQMLLPLAYRTPTHAGVVPLWFQGRDWWVAPPLLAASWGREGGGRSTWVTPLFHIGSDAAGRTTDWHALNVVHSGDTSLVLPLAWSSGPPLARHHGLLPAWVDGPGYWASPVLLSGRWSNPAGGDTTWITPLFHRSTDATGAVGSMHLLTWFHDRDSDVVLPLGWIAGAPGHRHGALLPLYFQGEDYQVLLPLAYRIGRSGEEGQGIVPLWFQGRGWWLAPPLLSGSMARADGGRSTWVTPLYHRTDSGDGRAWDRHLGLWFDGASAESSYQVLFPLAYRLRSGGQTWAGVAPLWFSGPGGRVAPLALSGSWDNAEGGSTTWITPLFHRSTRADGSVSSQHAGPWLEGGNRLPADADGSANADAWRLLLPLWYAWDSTRHGVTKRYSGLAPLWFAGPDSLLIPPLLSSWRREADGGSDTWVTPLFHLRRAADGSVSALNALLWYQEGDRQMLMPFYYRSGSGAQSRLGIIPLWFSSPEGWSVPPALSWSRQTADGGRSTWITPLFHIDRAADGSLDSLHALNWLQGRDWQMLFPIAYRSGERQGIIPLVFRGADWWTVPAALSGSWARDGGGRTTWVTPLFHHGSDGQGRTTDWHALNVVHSGDTDLVLPLAWRSGPAGARHSGVFPLWATGPGYTVVPPLLSASWRRDDGGSTTWITPLFHHSSDAQGRTTDWHVLNVLHAGDSDAILPLAWASGPPGERSRVVLPLWFQGKDHLVVAPLYYQYEGGDGTRRGVVPLWFSGPGWWAAPLGLSAGWEDGRGGSTTMITPFYHRTTQDGRVQSKHVLNWIETGRMRALAPLYWDWSDDAGGQRTLLAPLWYQHRSAEGGYSATFLPAAFAYRQGQRLDTGLATQLFPFLVQNATDGHEVNVLWRLFHLRQQAASTELMIAPLWWSESRPGEPLDWQVLGGLVGRDVDRRARSSLSYALWGALRFGGRTTYTPESP